VTYNIATTNGTATSAADYIASSLTGESIAAGATSKTFAVTINVTRRQSRTRRLR